jgi:hypothetical protein
MTDPMKPFHVEEYVKGQEAVAKDVAAARFEDQARLLGRAGVVAMEAMDHAKQLASDGDPHKQRVADLINESLYDAMKQVAAGRGIPEEGRADQKDVPFSSAGSLTSETSLPGTTKALPGSSNGSPQTPKRGRGRPPKDKKG